MNLRAFVLTHRKLTEKARKDWDRLAAGYKAFREEQGTYNELVEVPAMLALIGDVKGQKESLFSSSSKPGNLLEE
jgi:hypothetical protein